MTMRRINTARFTSGPLALAVFVAASGAGAQVVAPEAIETVVVTAQHRVERLQDVPISVKAFSSKQIDAMGIRSTQDFADLTPNLSFDNSFTYRNSFVTIRGVSQVNNADAPVAVVVDGVPQNNQKQIKMNLFDIERIEVLKGPQGALYGRNAVGGVINIETKAPTAKSASFIGAEYGSGNAREVSGGVNGSAADGKALFRVAGQIRQADGRIANTWLSRKVDAVDHDGSLRGRAILDAADGVRLDFRAGINDFAAGANWDSLVRSGNPNDIRAPRSSMFGKTEGSAKDFSVKAEIDTPIATLTAITGYADLTEHYRGDLDFSNPGDPDGGLLGPLPFQLGQGQNLDARMLSQELRLTSAADQPLRWIAGAYYLKTRRDLETRAFVDADSRPEQWDDLAKNIARLAETNDNNAYALFGQLDYDIGLQTTLSGMLRYDRDLRRQTDALSGLRRSDSFDAWQPKMTLTRRLDRGRLAYATYSTGFRSGGFNAPGLDGFKPETLRNLELGFKSSLLGQRLILNAAVFHSRSTDFQFFHVDAASASQIIGNIDQVGIKGADIDFRYLPAKDLELDGGLGIANSRIKRNATDPATVGNYTPKATPWQLNFGLQHSAPVAASCKVFFRLDYEHRSKKYWHPDNAAVSDALDLFGLRAGLHDIAGKWSVNLFARNLTDRKYYADYNSARYSGGVVDIGSPARGRTIGLEAKLRFE